VTQAGPLLVALLGATSYTYAEVTDDEQMENWLARTCAFEFYGGVQTNRIQRWTVV
jgi:transposase